MLRLDFSKPEECKLGHLIKKRIATKLRFALECVSVIRKLTVFLFVENLDQRFPLRIYQRNEMCLLYKSWLPFHNGNAQHCVYNTITMKFDYFKNSYNLFPLSFFFLVFFFRQLLNIFNQFDYRLNFLNIVRNSEKRTSRYRRSSDYTPEK